jgi:hypothetical protein
MMKAKGIFLALRVALLTILMGAATVSPTFAGGVVTDCSNSAQFNSMVTSGGTVTFNCGTALIHLSSTKFINAQTTIDGGGQITLSSDNARQLFWVNAGTALTLRNIVLTNGFSNGDGGAIVNNGALALENSAIRNSEASGSGGAIVSYGPLHITNSVLEGNRAYNGGALYPRFSSAQTVIVNSILRNNRVTGYAPNAWGGAILAWDGAVLTIQGSDIYSNTAYIGGGIYNFANSVLFLVNTRLRDNVSSNGGGIYNAGTATLTDVTLSGNSARDGGGIYNAGTTTLTGVTLSGNSADSGGGGIQNDNPPVTATLTDVTLSGNSARFGGGINNNGAATLTNVTLSGNSASYDGGGFRNWGAATLTNVTLSGNSATREGGGIALYSGSVTLKNTLVANSSSGGNCHGNVTNNGFNLSSDYTCFFDLERNGVNVMLGPLADNGGPTLTHMPQPGSPAIDHGSRCPATDQRGVARPVGAACDVGAVEYEAAVGAPGSVKLYLPLVLR